jgi:hypothetical protein
LSLMSPSTLDQCPYKASDQFGRSGMLRLSNSDSFH